MESHKEQSGNQIATVCYTRTSAGTHYRKHGWCSGLMHVHRWSSYLLECAPEAIPQGRFLNIATFTAFITLSPLTHTNKQSPQEHKSHFDLASYTDPTIVDPFSRAYLDGRLSCGHNHSHIIQCQLHMKDTR